MKNKIIYDLSTAGATRAGVYVFASNLFKALKRLDVKNEIITFNNPFSTVNKKGLFRKINSLFRLLFNELIIFKGSSEDFFFFPVPEVPFSILLWKRKYGVTIHDLYAWNNRSATTSFAQIKLKILPMIIDRAEIIFTVSEFSKNEIVECFHINENKIKVIHNGLNINFTVPTNQNSPFEILEGKRYLLNVGSLEPRKNIQFLVELFIYIKDNCVEHKDFKLVLTGGESWKINDVMEKIKTCKYKNDIHILGSIEDKDLPALYKQAQAMVFPSTAEGFGIPVIESLSQGTPVVINNNTALTEFKEYGAMVLDNYDMDVWSKVINDIVENKTKVKKENIANLKNKYNWESSAKSFFKYVSCKINEGKY